MKKIFMVFIIIILMILSSCENYLIVNIDYSKNVNIVKGDNVYLNDTVIGKVIKIKDKDKTKEYKIAISREYSNNIKEDARFYLFDHKIIVMPGYKNELLQSDIHVKGHGTLEYIAHKGADKIVKSVNDFLKSKEYENFRKSLVDLIEKGKDESENVLPEVEKLIDEYLEELQKKYGDEFEEKVKPHVDSLLDNLKVN